jgi:hypothetical protein
VPEIGRPLQTGPIASPGSFPDGTGGVGIVRAPYLGAAVNQFKEIADREQAALEEAKKREADPMRLSRFRRRGSFAPQDSRKHA